MPAASAPQTAPRLLREGHRLMYPLAALLAVVAMAFWGHWIGQGLAQGVLPTKAMPANWHAHEMIFGYGGAVMAGIFLANPPKGLGWVFFPALAMLWLAGRLAIAFSATLPAATVAAVDLSFGLLVMARMATPLFRKFNLQTLGFVVIFWLHWMADLAMHLDWMGVIPGIASPAAMAGLMACATMNAAFGGRLVAGLTRNAMVHAGETALPRVSGGLDRWAVMFTGFCVPAAFLPARAFGSVMVVAGAMNLLRLMAWRSGWAFRNDALLSGFHLAFLCLGMGLYAMGLAGVMAMEIFTPATHLLAVGAVAGLSMAVMVKSSLGRAARPAVATAPIKLAGVLLIGATALRASLSDPLWLMVSAVLFALAYAAVLAGLVPALFGPKLQPGQPGARPLGHGHGLGLRKEKDQGDQL